MTEALLNALCLRLNMTREQVLEQAIQFAYANAKMENPNITLDMVRKVALEK